MELPIYPAANVATADGDQNSCIWISRHPWTRSHEVHDVSRPAVIRVDADADNLPAAHQTHSEVAHFVNPNDKQLSVSCDPLASLTLSAAMMSRRMGRFQAIKMAINMTQAAMMVLVSAT
jgi:hypothetical protein